MLPTVAQLCPDCVDACVGHLRRCKKLTDYQDLSGEIYQFLESRIRAANASLTSLKSLLTLVLVLLRPITKTWKFSPPADVSLSCPILVGHPEKKVLVAF